MPHVFAFVIAGAGLYAGYKWVARALADADAAVRRRDEALRSDAARATGTPKDLGTLDYDAETGVYRPRGKA